MASPQTWEFVDGWLHLYRNFLAPAKAQALYQQLEQTLAWRQDEIRLFGRLVALPRLQYWIADPGLDYRYSGLKLAAAPWPAALQALRAELSLRCATPFNSVLINLYRNGQDSIGWHADNEPELGSAPCLASLSLGATRRFLLRHRHSGQRLELPLEPGSLLVMGGTLQSHWQHAIPKTRRQVAGRINLTFRYLQRPAD